LTAIVSETMQETGTLEARNWLRAAEDAGLIPAARPAAPQPSTGHTVIRLDDGMVSGIERANAVTMAAELAKRDGTVTELAVREGVLALIVPTSDNGCE
jgi:hypothetical protein